MSAEVVKGRVQDHCLCLKICMTILVGEADVTQIEYSGMPRVAFPALCRGKH